MIMYCHRNKITIILFLRDRNPHQITKIGDNIHFIYLFIYLFIKTRLKNSSGQEYKVIHNTFVITLV